MAGKLLAIVTACLVFSPAAYAKEDCYSCHGRKGSSVYIERADFVQSVHGRFACTGCHITVSTYPHGKVSKVSCGICHFLGREGAPHEQAQEYKLSVHGRAVSEGNAAAPSCQTCHGSHYIYPSTDARSKTSREKIPILCFSCHRHEFEMYGRSIHGIDVLGGKNLGAATCFDCHLEHRIPKATDKRWELALIEQCGSCHPEQINTYRKTYHGKVTELGYATIAKCVDCHGSHNILAPSDPNSTLSQNNIVTTCRTCHPRATAGFTKFYAHAEESNRAKYPVLYYTYIFMTTLLIGVFTFFFIHTSLWAFRSLKERMAKKRGE